MVTVATEALVRTSQLVLLVLHAADGGLDGLLALLAVPGRRQLGALLLDLLRQLRHGVPPAVDLQPHLLQLLHPRLHMQRALSVACCRRL